MKRAIVIGANGQDGFYLSNILRHSGIEVLGVSRSGNYHKVDIEKFKDVSELVLKFKPDFIFHLAANSNTRHDTLFENHNTITNGTINILESVKQLSTDCKVFISGSGLQFINHQLPIKEDDDFQPKDAYSMSRIQSVYAARYYRSIGIKVYVGYFFNHDSPLRSEQFIAKRISETAKRISNGSKELLKIGNLHSIREFGFAGDIMDALWIFVNQEQFFEANLATGIGYKIEDWIKICFDFYGIAWKNYITIDDSYVSPYASLTANTDRMRSLGWSPKIDINSLSKMMIGDEKL